MRTKSIIRILLLCITPMLLSSCWFTSHTDDPETVVYNLAFSLEDSNGKDLVKGIELYNGTSSTVVNADCGYVKPESYTLNIDAPYTPPQRVDVSYDQAKPFLTMKKDNDHICYLANSFYLSSEYAEARKVLTYTLKMPYAFGNENEHKIVAYWDIPNGVDNYNQHVAKCLRVEFDGKSIPVEESMIVSITGDKHYRVRIGVPQ